MLSFDTDQLFRGHLFREFFRPYLFESFYTGDSVRSKYKAEYLGHKAAKLFAIIWVAVGIALSAGVDLLFGTTLSNIAPGRFFISMTAGALLFQIPFAGTTIEAAKGDQARIRYNFFHNLSLVEVVS